MSEDDTYMDKIVKTYLVISKERKFIYIRIGKCASSSITGLLEKEISNLIHFETGNPEDLRYLKKSKIFNDWIETFKREDYFVFAFVRNPWDRVVSIWNYHFEYHKTPFKEFIRSDFKYENKMSIFNHSRQMVDYFFTNLDYVGKYENLEDDWKHIAEIIGVSPKLSHMNEGERKRKQRLHYTKYYDDSDIDIIRKRYKDDIETFNYKFGLKG